MNCCHAAMNARAIQNQSYMVSAMTPTATEPRHEALPSLVDWLSNTDQVYVVGTTTPMLPQSTQAPLEVYFGEQNHHGVEQKRHREDDDSWATVAMTPMVVSPHGSSHKRSRSNNYQPPRQVPPSVTSAMGSLVGGSTQHNPLSVQLRRQLSGSRLDQYIGNHDRMEVDAVTSLQRPRSMSF